MSINMYVISLPPPPLDTFSSNILYITGVQNDNSILKKTQPSSSVAQAQQQPMHPITVIINKS